MELKEIVTKLTGPTSPIGESNYDAEAKKNIENYIVLVEALVGELYNVYFFNRNRYEASRAEIGDIARQALVGLADYTDVTKE